MYPRIDPTRPIDPGFSDRRGFTLIELISVLVIISVLASVLVPRFLNIDTTSRLRAIDVGVADLNGRETLTWAMVKLSVTGYLNDQQVWDQLKVNPGLSLGADYSWDAQPTITGGSLRFKNETSALLNRNASSIEIPGKWLRQ
jgi:prepilin-type N-terminal cleavage/methylation domain-containing protein